MTSDPVRDAADWIRQGGVVVFPTETFYGLAVDPGCPTRLPRCSTLKGRAAGTGITTRGGIPRAGRESSGCSARSQRAPGGGLLARTAVARVSTRPRRLCRPSTAARTRSRSGCRLTRSRARSPRRTDIRSPRRAPIFRRTGVELADADPGGRHRSDRQGPARGRARRRPDAGRRAVDDRRRARRRRCAHPRRRGAVGAAC